MRALLAAALLAGCAHPAATNRGPFGRTWSEEITLREGWLEQRHALVLDLMRKHHVAMWMIVNEEFHDDPLTQLVAPPRPYAGNRDVFVFVDAGAQGLKRYAITGFAEESLSRFFDSPEDFRKTAEGVKAVVARHDPATIALSIEPKGGSRGVTRSLTKASYDFLVETLGPDLEKRFVPAAPLIVDYLDTRLPAEREPYRQMVRLTEELTRRALSNEVIHPGRTRVGDVRRWLYDQLGARGLSTWFQPDLRVQRKGMAKATSRGFLAVADEAMTLERGDLVHIDFGLTHLGLNTDWQKMAYVLRDGESDAPAGLRAALANTNAAQDLLVRESRPGRSSADVYDAVMAALKARGIAAQIYSHPLGNQGHGLGAGIDFRSAQRKEAPRLLREGSYLAMELNTKTAVPEWGGEDVFAMEEDPVELTAEGWRFFVPRQTELYLVH